MPALDKAHALVIGIAGYHHVRRLPQVQDAAAVAALLADPELGAYPPGQVMLLQDAAATGAAARVPGPGRGSCCHSGVSGTGLQ